MRRAGALALLLAALLAPPVCGRAERPGVILVCVDTLRVDRASLLAGGLPLTPALDQWGRTGIRDSQAIAPSSWSQPSIASLFPGRARARPRRTARPDDAGWPRPRPADARRAVP